MEQEQQFLPFGYTEMYEWQNVPDELKQKAGLFVQFSKSEPEKIEKYRGGELCGVTTACFSSISDNPIEWSGKYISNFVGEFERVKKYIAVGNKVYDQAEELNIVRTFPYKIYQKQLSDDYDKSKQYVQRINRIEWQLVTILGKAIVQDDGTCEVGGYCAPYDGDDYTKAGIGTKANEDEGFYVMKRVSPNSVLILYK